MRARTRSPSPRAWRPDFPGAARKESACQCKKHRRGRFDPWVGKIPWRRKCPWVLVVARGALGAGSAVVARGLSCSVPCGIFVTQPGIEPTSPALACLLPLEPPSYHHPHPTPLCCQSVCFGFPASYSQPMDRTPVSCIGRWVLYCLSHQGKDGMKLNANTKRT